MGGFIPPILTFAHFIMEVYSTLNAPLAYLSFLHILILLLFKCIIHLIGDESN